MSFLPQTLEDRREKLLDLLADRAYRFGEFTLASGRKSNHYVNCKPISLSGIGLLLISDALLNNIESDSIAVAGLTLGADPLVSGVAIAGARVERVLDALIVRKEPKGYGTKSWLEGPLPPKGSLITVLEDVVTTGGSSIKAVRHLREAGYLVERVVTIVDRQEGAAIAMKDARLELISLFLLEEIVDRASKIEK